MANDVTGVSLCFWIFFLAFSLYALYEKNRDEPSKTKRREQNWVNLIEIRWVAAVSVCLFCLSVPAFFLSVCVWFVLSVCLCLVCSVCLCMICSVCLCLVCSVCLCMICSVCLCLVCFCLSVSGFVLPVGPGLFRLSVPGLWFVMFVCIVFASVCLCNAGSVCLCKAGSMRRMFLSVCFVCVRYPSVHSTLLAFSLFFGVLYWQWWSR